MKSKNSRAFGVAAAAALAALGLGACSSSSSASAPTTSVPVTTTLPGTGPAGGTSTTGNGNSSSPTSQADAICAEIKTANKGLANLDLTSPDSAKSAVSTMSGDLSQLQQLVNNVSVAGQKGSSSGPLQTMVNDVKQAVGTGQSALTSLAEGDTSAATNRYHQAVKDLDDAEQTGKSADFKSCT